MNNTELYSVIKPIVESLGYELWGHEYFLQGKYTMLRIYIDKSGGVTMEDCQNVSGQLSAALDVADIISIRYALEVSSPGIQRPLFNKQQYLRYLGHRVSVRVRGSIGGQRNFNGLLKSIEDDCLTIEYDSQQVILPICDIEKASLLD